MTGEHGWVMLYHGVDEHSIYRVGVMLLDREQPARVVARAPAPVMEPKHYYERIGLVIPNVIFPTANPLHNGVVYVYYSCADTCISLATVKLGELVDEVRQWPTARDDDRLGQRSLAMTMH